MTAPRARWLTLCAAVLLLPSLAGAAPVAEGPFQGVRRGDRVRLVLKSKCPFSGVVRAVSSDTVTLDLRWEERGVEGTMSFTADLVRKVEVLAAWDLAELEERRSGRMKRLQEAEEDLRRVAAERESVRRADEEQASRSAAEAAKASSRTKAPATVDAMTAEEMEKGIALLKEFPPTDGWGTASDKTRDWLSSKFATIGAALTPAEQRFVENYDLWLKAKQAMAPTAPGPVPAAEIPASPAQTQPPDGGAPSPALAPETPPATSGSSR
jgi:hypothetical protein